MNSPKTSYMRGAAGAGGAPRGAGGASRAAATPAPANRGQAALQRGGAQRVSPVSAAMITRSAMPNVADDGPSVNPDRD